MKLGFAVTVLMCLLAAQAYAQNKAQAGRFFVEPPTLINLGFEWEISGDANRNAKVEVRYRETGTADWKEALPLLRIGGEKIGREKEHLEYITPHKFAGSILDLKPGTEYECRFTMSDADGVEGTATQTVRVKTRTEPKAATGGRTLHVYPPDWKGERQEPSFTGILEAYYGAGMGDWNVVWERKAKPGDVILVHAGLYKSDRLNYVDPLMAPFDGAYSLTLKGTPERPIVIRGAGDGEVIFDGAGSSRLFDVMASEYHIFEDLTIRNVDYAFFAGQKNVIGAKGLTVRNCRFEDVGVGVWTEYAGSKDFFITDNLILGRDDRYRLLGWASSWTNPGIYGGHALKSYYGIKVYGSGHVIAHNSVAYFHDGIGVSTYGTPEPERELWPVAIDIYNNDIHMCGDDFIEMDGAMHNIRVMRNRLTNAAHGGISAQPVFGGPAYVYRNIIYNVQEPVAFKFESGATGLLVYHNTVIASQGRRGFGYSEWRNNLFLGFDVEGRGIMAFSSMSPLTTFDYNGYRPNRNAKPQQYTWLTPGPTDVQPHLRSHQDWKVFPTLAALQAGSGQETHGMEIDYDIFENLAMPDSRQRHAVYHAVNLNFRLKANAKAVDAGARLPTVNDDYAGRAPDLGAYEVGQPEPQYGPRRKIKQPFYQ